MLVWPTRRFILQIGGAALFFPNAACTHQPPALRIPKVGVLIGPFPTMLAAFQGELARLGYVPGQNIILETGLSPGRAPDLGEQIAALAKMDLDLIMAAALPVADEVRTALPSMRMVIATAPGLVTNGYAESLEHPGGNVTGMEELPPGLTRNRLTLLKAVAPTTSRVALLSTTPGRGGHEMQVADAEAAAIELGVSLKTYRVTSLRELQPALDAMVTDGVDGLGREPINGIPSRAVF